MTESVDQDRDVEAPFSRLCALEPVDEHGRYRGTIAHPWMIGPKPHGGAMVAASAAAATRWLREAAPALTDLRPVAASTDFLNAPDPGEVEYAVDVRKTGRQISLVDVTLSQDGRSVARTGFTFGRFDDAPPLWAPPQHADMPAEPPHDALPYAGTPLGEVVHLSRAASMFLDGAHAPFLAGQQGEPRLRLWLRPAEGDQRDADLRALLGLMAADASPPVTLNLGRMSWAPTVQLTTYLRRVPARGWLRIVATAQEVGPRMFDEDQLVLDSTGAIVAQSRQLALLPTS